MSILNSITSHPIILGVGVVVLFVGWRFYLKPKLDKEKEESKSNAQDNQQEKDRTQPVDSTPGEKETSIKRMKRGFGVMYDKINNSQIVRNIKSEQYNPKEQDDDPMGLKQMDFTGDTDLGLDKKKIDF